VAVGVSIPVIMIVRMPVIMVINMAVIVVVVVMSVHG
jgi:hypothetical protein